MALQSIELDLSYILGGDNFLKLLASYLLLISHCIAKQLLQSGQRALVETSAGSETNKINIIKQKQ